MFRGTTRSRQAGFTLAEVMIALAIFAMGAAAMMSMSNLSNKQYRTQVARSNAYELIDEIKTRVRSQADCSTMFGAAALASLGSPYTFGQNIDIGSTGLTVNGTNYNTGANNRYPAAGADQVYITSIYVNKAGYSPGPGVGSATLNVVFSKTKPTNAADNNFVGGRYITRSIPINLYDAAGADNIVDTCNIGTVETQEVKSELVVCTDGDCDCEGFLDTAITNCINLANSATNENPRNIVIRAGEYTINNTITVPANVSIRGEGSTILRKAAGSCTVFSINQGANTRTEFKNLVFDTSGCSSASTSTIAITNTPNVYIRDNLFIDSNGTDTNGGIEITTNSGKSNYIIENNRFTGSADPNFHGAFPIRITGTGGIAVQRTLLRNNFMQYVAGSGQNVFGISLDGLFNDVAFEGNTIEAASTGTGFNVALRGNSTNMRFKDNTMVMSTTAVGAQESRCFNIFGNAGTPLTGLAIDGNSCTITTSAAVGLMVWDAINLYAAAGDQDSRSQITNNKFTATGTSGVGIQLARAYGVVVSDNSIVNFPTTGIAVNNGGDNSNSNLVSNNSVRGSEVGISIRSDRVIGNNIRNVGIGVLGNTTATCASSDYIISDNYIDLKATTTASCYAGAPSYQNRTAGICISACRGSVHGNRIRTRVSNDYAIHFPTGVSDTMYVFLNRMTYINGASETPVSATYACGNCSSYSSLFQWSDGTIALYNGAGVELNNNGQLYMTDTARIVGDAAGTQILMRNGSSVNLQNNAQLNLQTGSDMNVTGGGNIDLTGGGGINVGSGSPVANKVTVDGNPVINKCWSRVQDTQGGTTAGCPSGGTECTFYLDCATAAPGQGLNMAMSGGAVCPANSVLRVSQIMFGHADRWEATCVRTSGTNGTAWHRIHGWCCRQ